MRRIARIATLTGVAILVFLLSGIVWDNGAREAVELDKRPLAGRSFSGGAAASRDAEPDTESETICRLCCSLLTSLNRSHVDYRMCRAACPGLLSSDEEAGQMLVENFR